MKYHYTYRITNTKHHKHYYGVRSSKVEPKIDLGVNYFSSSSDKGFIKDQKINPQDYKYKIIKMFNTKQQAIVMEIKLHNRFNVGMNESFYNRAKQTSIGFDTTGTIAWNNGNNDQSRCPHCGKDGQTHLMLQWHFNNCIKHPINAQTNINNRKLISTRKSGKNNPMYGKTGLNNRKSRQYHIMTNEHKVFKTVIGTEIKQVMKNMCVSERLRYCTKANPYNTHIIKMKKYIGWYVTHG